MNNDILVVRVNMFLKNKEQESVRQYILEQRKTGVIMIKGFIILAIAVAIIAWCACRQSGRCDMQAEKRL